MEFPLTMPCEADSVIVVGPQDCPTTGREKGRRTARPRSKDRALVFMETPRRIAGALRFVFGLHGYSTPPDPRCPAGIVICVTSRTKSLYPLASVSRLSCHRRRGTRVRRR